MKRFFIFAIAALLGACNSDSKQDSETTKAVVLDSAQYQNTVATDTAASKTTVVATPPPAPVENVKAHKETTTREKHTSNSTSASTPVTTSTSASNTSTTTTSPATTSTTTTSTAPVTETPTVTPEKKGMSHSAKDAIIAGGAGAVGGAIISHKKGKGAIIGGVLGAGAGYIFGKNKDKKDTTR